MDEFVQFALNCVAYSVAVTLVAVPYWLWDRWRRERSDRVIEEATREIREFCEKAEQVRKGMGRCLNQNDE